MPQIRYQPAACRQGMLLTQLSLQLGNHFDSSLVWVSIDKKGFRQHVLAHQDALDVAHCLGWSDGVVEIDPLRTFAMPDPAPSTCLLPR